MGKKIAFRNLGCKVNEYELEYMQQRMLEKGYEIVAFDTKADIYVVNTCTVTNIADRKSRQMLHQAKKRNPEAVVVAVGCYVQTDTEGARNDDAIDIMVGNNQKSNLSDIVEEYLCQKDKNNDNTKTFLDSVVDLTEKTNYEDMHIERTGEHTRAFIKIQDGCNQFCSYCAIPIARGRIRSRKPEDVVDEVTALSKNGYKEIVLTGIHLSSYGIDFKPDENGRIQSYNELAKDGSFTNDELAEVILAVSKIDGIERIRLGSLEPRLITKEFLEKISRIPQICPHFHLSLQSGCDETLKRMNRRYTTEEFERSVNLLREYFDNPAITTDVIVGFPGETDEEFEITRKYLEKIKFFELHVFKYSKRKNTAAAVMNNQVPEEVKSLRSDILIELDQKLSDEFRNSYLGREVSVLFEEEKNGKYVGHTKEYIMVASTSENNLKGEIVNDTIDGVKLSFV